MKSAIVLGARQQFGFKICEELLEDDYLVFAKDFIQWQTNEQKENWLYIGRNAHLNYTDLEKAENIYEEKSSLVIIPLVDFYTREETKAHDLLISILKDQSFTPIQTPLVLIQPYSMQRSYSTFSQAIEKLKEERMKMGGEVLEYHLPMKSEGIYFRLNDHYEWIKNTDREEIATVIYHLGEKINIDSC
ncbi:hypothetical protein [Lederbergia galactosidilytica]|uniref:Uncharacterized protein n=1 Tax=Lederbergia galactosidilytica TaxID=217031 RepID=A0A177ZIG0_9BACI|nr:hypothetical protein [Lederbergia galactosidilytica]OAK67736.1 hypothetical protein ABB05_18725 [Lederbergia galactosidilytica]